MKKLLYLLLIIPVLAIGITADNGWRQVGNTLNRTVDGFKYSTILGVSPGRAFWYQMYQVDSIITAVRSQIPTSLPPSGTAGGDLTGTYPNPTVNTVNSITKTFYDPTSSIQTQLNSKQTLANLESSVTQSSTLYPSGQATYNALLVARNAANFGLTTTLADVGHYALPSAGDQTMRVGAWLNIRSVTTTDSVKVTVTWTDNASVSQTKIFYTHGVPNSGNIGTVSDYSFSPTDFRALSGTTVQVTATVSGSGTILYEVGCTIQKLIGDGGL